MKQTIALSANQFTHGGGIESYTFDLVRQLADEPQTVVKVYATKFDTTLPEYSLIKPELINQKRIPKKLRPFFFAPQLKRRRGANERLIACNPADDADVFICGGNHLGYLRAMGLRANFIDKLAVRRNRSNYASAKTIMAHSGMMQRELVDLYGVPPEKIRTVHPPADTERFYPNPEEIEATRIRLGWRDDETIFLFPSTGHKRKGLDLLAAFFEQTGLPVRLAVAGSPLPRPMRNVQALGFCKNMPELYRAADYTIMASLFEPFGLVGVESVLCGTRVLLADNMGCCEVMNEQAGFFFPRENASLLAAAVAKAVALKQSGEHKIIEPMQALTYNPTLEHHINQLFEMLDI
ncbi:MAG: glycosyltransferase family 4 protein [Neisseria sp.]|uniref:glycosyltransferase family 4 protein n=1 Tax=Neisseria sp. TaxID=192066 RepID=UPI0026DB551C|nr:glycosyltransferase family 4 protein [Neisseria sp.]MDO4641995.1 glycosyltransferase family 4 protein [Neisseria sp.]